jgi:hypothetical protein
MSSRLLESPAIAALRVSRTRQAVIGADDFVMKQNGITAKSPPRRMRGAG